MFYHVLTSSQIALEERDVQQDLTPANKMFYEF